MAQLSPSIVRLELPIDECVRILNCLKCNSVHIDVCQHFTFPYFFNIEEVSTGVLRGFDARVTFHLFWHKEESMIHFGFLRENDLAILHIFPQTPNEVINDFLRETTFAGCKKGLSVDIRLTPKILEGFLPQLDFVFVMGIPVATYGLHLNAMTIEKLDQASDLIRRNNPNCQIGLDGGVNGGNFSSLVKKVDELVIGSLLFHTDDLVSQWEALRRIAEGGEGE